jgi:Tyrosine phosphatase family
MRDFDPLDQAYVADVLSRPPFVNISGVTNVRDLGSYPSTTHPGKIVKPKLLFRSAEVSSITEEGMHSSVHPYSSYNLISLQGKAQLKALGIVKIFDLRSDTEIQKYKSPLPNIDGVDIIQAPVFKTEDYSPEAMAKYVRDTP